MGLHHPLDTSVFRIEAGSLANPNAGADFTWTPPTFSRVLILSVQYFLQTDANGAGRILLLKGNDGTDDFQVAQPVGSQPVSTTVKNSWTPNVSGINSIATYLHLLHTLPYPMILQVGDTLQSEILAMQAADQITTIRIRYAAWQDI